MIRIKRFFVNNRAVLLSYLFVLCAMTAVYAVIGIYPFGKLHVLDADMREAYAPRISELAQKLSEGGSLMYSWHGSLGSDYFMAFVTSLMNPFLLLTVLFGAGGITETIGLIFLLQVPLCAAAFAYWVSKKYDKRDITVIIFAAGYALSSFIIMYMMVFYWLLSFAMLPLVAAGLDKLRKNGDFRLYAIALGIGVTGNYLMGMFLCIFSVVYYFHQVMSDRGEKLLDKKIFPRYALGSVLGVGIGAFVLMTAVSSMGNTAYAAAGSKFPAFQVFFSFPQVFAAAFFDLKPAYLEANSNAVANLYCGILSLLLAVLYFVHPKIELRKKMLSGGILLFFAAAISVSWLSYSINGFRYPSGLPHRFAFIVVFFLLMLGLEAFIKIAEFGLMRFLITVGAFLVALGLLTTRFKSEFAFPGYFTQKAINENFMLVGIFALLLGLFVFGIAKLKKGGRAARVVGSWVITLAVLAELTANATIALGEIWDTAQVRDNYVLSMKTQMETLKPKMTDTAFYRAEVTPNLSYCDGRLFDYNAASTFSIAYTEVTDLLRHLGILAGTNRVEYKFGSPLLNMMLGMKYSVNRSYLRDKPLQYYTEIADAGTLKLYENTRVLPLAYMVDPDVKNYDFDDEDAFSAQNQLLRRVTGLTGDLYLGISEVGGAGQTTNAELTFKDDPTTFTYSAPDTLTSADSVSFDVKYTITHDGPAIVTLDVKGSNRYIIYINGQEYFSRSSKFDVDSFDIGERRVGDIVTVRTEIENSPSRYAKRKSTANLFYLLGLAEEPTAAEVSRLSGSGFIDIRTFDRVLFDDAYAALSDSVYNVTEYGDTFVRGDIYAKQSGVFMSTVPYDKRWSVTVDGKKVKTFAALNAFVAFDLEAGEHDIEFSYSQSLPFAGIAVSVICLVLVPIFGRGFKNAA